MFVGYAWRRLSKNRPDLHAMSASVSLGDLIEASTTAPIPSTGPASFTCHVVENPVRQQPIATAMIPMVTCRAIQFRHRLISDVSPR